MIGKAAEGVKAVGEVRLPDLMTRPDYAVTRQGLIGFIELKAPGKGSDPTAFPTKSPDRIQWEKLKFAAQHCLLGWQQLHALA